MMITGFLLFGGCGFLLYRKVREVKAALLAFEQLPAFAGIQSNFAGIHSNLAGLYRMVDTQSDDQKRNMDTLSQSFCELNRKLDTKYSGNGILQRVSERL
ncbi:unnamed protein product [Boreogadus saida]